MPVILVVEDEMPILNNMCEILHWYGYEVVSATNGREALAHLQTIRPDVILSDILMPYLDGRELFAHVKAMPSLADVPFLFITASAEKKEIESALAAGATGYLVKPFTPKQLITIVEKALKH